MIQQRMFVIFTVTLALILQACSDSNDDDSPRPTATPTPTPTTTPTPTPDAFDQSIIGVWRGTYEDQALFFEINAEGEFIHYNCTINEGYIAWTDYQASISGSNVTMIDQETNENISFPVRLSENDIDTLEFLGGFTNWPDELTRLSTLPVACNDSLVEILSIDPEEIYEDLETRITVSYQYRNSEASNENLNVFIQASTFSEGEPLVVNELIPVSEGVSSGTFDFIYSYTLNSQEQRPYIQLRLSVYDGDTVVEDLDVKTHYLTIIPEANTVEDIASSDQN